MKYECPQLSLLIITPVPKREVLGKWVNGFRLKPYQGPMSRNPFEQTKTDTELDTGKPAKPTTRLATGKHEAGKHDAE